MHSNSAPFEQPFHLLDATMFWTAQSGGVRRYLREKHAWIAAHTTWRHTIATPLLDDVSRVRVPAVALPGSGGYRLPLARAAGARVLAAEMPDLIESGDPYRLAWSALDAAQRLGIPAVAFCHSNLEMLAGRFGGRAAARLARRYAGRLYRQFDLVLAPSRAMGGHLLEWGVARVLHQPLGVDTAVFRPGDDGTEWRSRLGLPDGARLLVYAGRFAPEKELGLLSAAVQRLGAPYWLVAVGAGPTPPHGERVKVVGHVESAAALARLFSSADLFVHAGAQETFGLAALEALACGTPVVARAAEGLAELVDASVGVAVPTGRSEAFADAIASLFDPGADRAALGLAARRRAEAYDWRSVLPALCRRYQRLVAGPAGKSSGAGMAGRGRGASGNDGVAPLLQEAL